MRLATRAAVAQLLGVNLRTLDRMGLPRVPIQVMPGQQRPLVRFDLDEIEAIIERQKRDARGLAA